MIDKIRETALNECGGDKLMAYLLLSDVSFRPGENMKFFMDLQDAKTMLAIEYMFEAAYSRGMLVTDFSGKTDAIYSLEEKQDG